MGFDTSQNDHLTSENFRRLIAQIVKEELAKLFGFQEPNGKELQDRIGDAVLMHVEQNEKPRSQKITNNWLTHSEAAAYLKVTSAVLYKLSSLRRIKYSKRGKKNYYKVEHLEQYLTEGEVQTRDEIEKNTRLKRIKII